MNLNILKRFCKGQKIVNVPMEQLYKQFSEINTGISREQFELGMLSLNKKPALSLKTLCRRYHFNDHKFGYDKFCREQSFITQAFWDKAVSYPDEQKTEKTPAIKMFTPEVEHDHDDFYKLMPVNWSEMSNSERIDFTQKIKHEKFKEYVINSDSRLKRFFSQTPAQPSKIKHYVIIFQFPSKNYSEESKNLLKCFVNNLNTLGRANLQFVECSNPDSIEIREVR